jgi:hypothetical protein
MPCASHTSARAENSADATISICSTPSCLLPVTRRRGMWPGNSIGRRMAAAGKAAASAVLQQPARPHAPLLNQYAAYKAKGVVCYCVEDRARSIYDPWVGNPRLLVDKQQGLRRFVQLRCSSSAHHQWLWTSVDHIFSGRPAKQERVGGYTDRCANRRTSSR